MDQRDVSDGETFFEALTDKSIAFVDYWQCRPGHFETLFALSTLQQLVPMADLDRLIVGGGLPQADVQIIESGRAREVPRTKSIAPAIDVDLLVAMFDRGRSFRIQHLENHLLPVAKACRSLEHLFGFPVRCNAYISPDLAAGLAPHYDSSDSFIVQLHGSKGWDIYDGYTMEKPLPLAHEPFSAGHHKPRGASRSITLRRGDLLYIPRGVMHRAYTTGSNSIHLTFSILGLSWAEAINQITMLAAQQTVSLRSLVPLGTFHAVDPESLSAHGQSLANSIDVATLFGELVAIWRAQFAQHKPSTRPGAFENRWMGTAPSDSTANVESIGLDNPNQT